MTLALKGKPVAQKIENDLKVRIQKLKTLPTLQIIRIGENDDDLAYEKSLTKNCQKLGINCHIAKLAAKASQVDLEKAVQAANQDPNVHGILVFRPLPEQLDIEPIRQMIAPQKDVDCMSPTNMGKIFSHDKKSIAPCTAQSVMAILDYYEVPLEGADVTIVGASFVVGRPLAMLLMDRMATVSVCQVYTKDVPAYTKKSEVVISACGVAKLLKENYFNEKAVVVDVGVNFDENGKLCGDVDYAQVFGKVKAITPAVGGVGSITSMILLSRVVHACEESEGGL